MGRFGAFSFHGTKTITTGEGGMFVTNDPDLYEQVLTLSNHGRARGQSKQFWPDMVGFKYKMSNIQAAIGCAQMQRIEILTRVKREIFKMYQDYLKDLPFRMNPEPKGCTNGYWMPTIVASEGISFNRDELIDQMKAKGWMLVCSLASKCNPCWQRKHLISSIIQKRFICTHLIFPLIMISQRKT